jgi:hypothetical protein
MPERPNEGNRAIVGYWFAIVITALFLAFELLHKLKLPPNLELLSNLNIAGSPLILLLLLVVLLLFPNLRKVKLFGLFELETNLKEIRQRTEEVQRTINTLIQSLSATAHARAIGAVVVLPKGSADAPLSEARMRMAEEFSDKKSSVKSTKKDTKKGEN